MQSSSSPNIVCIALRSLAGLRRWRDRRLTWQPCGGRVYVSPWPARVDRFRARTALAEGTNCQSPLGIVLLGLIPPERCAGQTLGLIDSLAPMELDEPSTSHEHASGVADPSVAPPWTQRLLAVSAPPGLIQDSDYPTPSAPGSSGRPDPLIAPTATDLWSGHDLRINRDHWADDRSSITTGRPTDDDATIEPGGRGGNGYRRG